MQYKNEGKIKKKTKTKTKNNNNKNNMKFVSVTNEKAGSTFHVPVQTPGFPCSQRSQGTPCVNVLEIQTAQKVCRARGPTDENSHFAISEEVNSLLHDFA